MNFSLALFVVAGFAATVEYFDLPDRARTVGKRSEHSLAVLQDDSLGDREKEEVLRSQSQELFRLLGGALPRILHSALTTGTESRIRFWTPVRNVIAVRRKEAKAEKSIDRRRFSKNSLNIACLATLPEVLWKEAFLIPLQDLVQPTTSMHPQYERFLQIHKEGAFMRDTWEPAATTSLG